MKKILLVVIMGLLLGTVVFADHAQDSLALGGVFGIGVGGNGSYLYPDFYPMNLSLHIPKVPIIWSVNIRFLQGFGFGITGDWYFAEPTLVSKTTSNDDGTYELKIDWYVGVGGYTNIYTGPFGGNVGLRIPFGVSWHAMEQIRQLEVSVGSVAGVGIGGRKNTDPFVDWFFIPLELGVRWWFDGK